jgi:hypothetical protein
MKRDTTRQLRFTIPHQDAGTCVGCMVSIIQLNPGGSRELYGYTLFQTGPRGRHPGRY